MEIEILKLWTPIIVSTAAFIVSFATLCWTIYRDAIRKPKFRVSVSLHRMLNSTSAPYIGLEGVNLGPEKMKASSTYLRENWLRRKILNRSVGKAFIFPDFRHPACSAANRWIEAGDNVVFVFPYDEDTEILADNFSQIGIADGLGRIHWAPKKQLKQLQLNYVRDFKSGKK